MRSMTGFGMGEYISENESITVEIKTVNHRYKDLSLRLPQRLSVLEDKIRKYTGERVNRGHIEISAKYNKYCSENVTLHYDAALAAAYKEVLEKISRDFPTLPTKVDIAEIAHYPNVVIAQSVSEDIESLWEKFKIALASALDMLSASRDAEGESLLKDFFARIDLVEEMVTKIQGQSEGLAKQYYETLKKNAAEYTQSPLNEERLYTELAVYADRVNITEELVRLKNHISNFRKTLSISEPVGKKLDFTLQEINREVNTIASKSNSFEISSLVIDIKAELEKMREQVQNIE